MPAKAAVAIAASHSSNKAKRAGTITLAEVDDQKKTGQALMRVLRTLVSDACHRENEGEACRWLTDFLTTARKTLDNCEPLKHHEIVRYLSEFLAHPETRQLLDAKPLLNAQAQALIQQ